MANESTSSPNRPVSPAPAARVRQVLARLVREGSAAARRDGTVHTLFPVAVSPAEGEAIRRWVIAEGAAHTVETGFGYGVSALFICEGLLTNGDPSARHVVIDPNQSTRFADCGLQFVDEAGVAGMVEHLADESLLALPRLLAERRVFDFAFVDGNHRFDGVFVDLVYLHRLVRAGGLIMLDDYQLPGVARAASFFRTNLGWTLEEVSASDATHQWAVLRTSRGPDQRPYDYFVDF